MILKYLMHHLKKQYKKTKVCVYIYYMSQKGVRKSIIKINWVNSKILLSKHLSMRRNTIYFKSIIIIIANKK